MVQQNGPGQRMQTLFAVVDYDKDPNHIEFGVGRGFTRGSDRSVIKLMITHEF